MADGRLKRRLSAGLGTRRHRVARVRPGTQLGTLVAAGTPAPARVSVIAYNREGATERRDVTIDDGLAALAPGGVTWINVDGLGDTTVLTRLGERFGLHRSEEHTSELQSRQYLVCRLLLEKKKKTKKK